MAPWWEEGTTALGFGGSQAGSYGGGFGSTPASTPANEPVPDAVDPNREFDATYETVPTSPPRRGVTRLSTTEEMFGMQQTRQPQQSVLPAAQHGPPSISPTPPPTAAASAPVSPPQRPVVAPRLELGLDRLIQRGTESLFAPKPPPLTRAQQKQKDYEDDRKAIFADSDAELRAAEKWEYIFPGLTKGTKYRRSVIDKYGHNLNGWNGPTPEEEVEGKDYDPDLLVALKAYEETGGRADPYYFDQFRRLPAGPSRSRVRASGDRRRAVRRLDGRSGR